MTPRSIPARARRKQQRAGLERAGPSTQAECRGSGHALPRSAAGLPGGKRPATQRPVRSLSPPPSRSSSHREPALPRARRRLVAAPLRAACAPAPRWRARPRRRHVAVRGAAPVVTPVVGAAPAHGRRAAVAVAAVTGARAPPATAAAAVTVAVVPVSRGRAGGAAAPVPLPAAPRGARRLAPVGPARKDEGREMQWPWSHLTTPPSFHAAPHPASPPPPLTAWRTAPP